MNTITRSMYGWSMLPWTRIQRQVFKLQNAFTEPAVVMMSAPFARSNASCFTPGPPGSWRSAKSHKTIEANGPQVWMGSNPYHPSTPRPGTVPHPRQHHHTCPPHLDPETRLDGTKTARHPDHGR
jgi:hypothetical protein